MSPLPSPAYSTPELVEIRQAKAIRSVDDDRVGVRNIHAALDDRGANENVGLAIDELAHHVFQHFAVHLTVTDNDTCLRAECLDFLLHFFNISYAIVQEENLATAFDFGIHRRSDDPLIISADGRLHGRSIGRRRL